MSKMIVDAIRRTGSATSKFRQLEVLQGKNRRVLSTPIEKLSWAPAFRHGKAAIPVEQYAFKVDGYTVERFADATALVLRKHHVEIDASVAEDELQTYVQKARAILAGRESLRNPAAPAVPSPTEEVP